MLNTGLKQHGDSLSVINTKAVIDIELNSS
jgi:hypothetical protein